MKWAREEAIIAGASLLGKMFLCGVGRSLKGSGRAALRLEKAIRDLGTCIIAFWHNKLFLATYCLAAGFVRHGGRVAVLASRSRDGEYIARMARMLGADEVVRGSSSRAGVSGLKRLCEKAASGVSICVTPDGPRGPRYEPKDGIVLLAQRTGLPVLPVSFRVKGRIELNSWDGFIVPLPFSEMEVRVGDPIAVPRRLDRGGRARIRDRIRGSLLELEV